MPRAPDKATRTARNKAMRLDRATGRTVRQIATAHRLSVSTVHRLVHDVRIILPRRWHLARMPKTTPLPPVCDVRRWVVPGS